MFHCSKVFNHIFIWIDCVLRTQMNEYKERSNKTYANCAIWPTWCAVLNNWILLDLSQKIVFTQCVWVRKNGHHSHFFFCKCSSLSFSLSLYFLHFTINQDERTLNGAQCTGTLTFNAQSLSLNLIIIIISTFCFFLYYMFNRSIHTQFLKTLYFCNCDCDRVLSYNDHVRFYVLHHQMCIVPYELPSKWAKNLWYSETVYCFWFSVLFLHLLILSIVGLDVTHLLYITYIYYYLTVCVCDQCHSNCLFDMMIGFLWANLLVIK